MDAAEAFERVRVPARRVTDDELGPIDLRSAGSDVHRARHASTRLPTTNGRVTVVDAYLDTGQREQPNVTVLADGR